MSKELKALEAVEKLKQYWNNEIPLSCPQGLKIVSIIETTLKRLNDIDNKPLIYMTRTRGEANSIIKELSKYPNIKVGNLEDRNKMEAIDLILSFNNYTITNVQGQWYLLQGNSFFKSPKIPITEDQAIALKEILK